MDKPEKPIKRKWLRVSVYMAVVLLAFIVWIGRTPPDYPKTADSIVTLPDSEGNIASAQEKKIIDPEVAALMPKSIPGHELGWLTGRWIINNSQCVNDKAVYIAFSAARDGLYTIAKPEPKNANSKTSVNGHAQVNPGERGFTYVTPPNWDDAYLRIKTNGQEGLEVEFVEFDRDGPDWKVTDTFTLQKCK